MENRQNSLQVINQKRADRKKKRIKRFFVRFAVFLAVAGIITITILSLTVFFPVKSISVINPYPYSAEQVVEKSGIKKGENVFMSGNNAEKSIVTALPYISKIKITRKLSGNVVIDITSATAVLAYKTEKGYYICDKNSKLLEIKNSEPGDVITVVGGKFKNAKVGYNLEFLNSEISQNIDLIMKSVENKEYKISSIDITNTAKINFEIKDRFIVTLGSGVNIENKLLHLDEMIKGIDKSATGYIDLSYWSEEKPRTIFRQSPI